MSRAQILRTCRLVHGWLSAGAFLILIFFAATGLALNHPEWQPNKPSRAAESSFSLSAAEEARLAGAVDPARAAIDIAAVHVSLAGAFKSGDEDGAMLYARMEGAKGTTDIRVDRSRHRVDVSIERADALSVLNELHRAEHAGPGWRMIVDLAAVGLVAMSLVGYSIFLGLRFQLRTALIITTVSGLILLGGMLWIAV
jgi:uncharacterized protein